MFPFHSKSDQRMNVNEINALLGYVRKCGFCYIKLFNPNSAIKYESNSLRLISIYLSGGIMKGFNKYTSMIFTE